MAAQDVHAQARSGAVVKAIANVNAGSGAGAAGCGGAGGSGSGRNLTAFLNAAAGTPGFSDPSAALADRRAAFRFCDSQSDTQAGGWSNDPVATATSIDAQAVTLAPEEVFAGMDSANASFDIQTANVARRLSLIRLSRARQREASEVFAGAARPGAGTSMLARSALDGRGPIGMGQLDRTENLLLMLQEGINAGDETGVSGLGFFLNGRIHIIDANQNKAERGSDGVGGGFTIGGDKRISDELHAGVALGYTKIATNYDNSASESDLDAVTLSLYGGWYPSDEIVVDGLFSVGWLGLDTTNELALADLGPPVGDLKGNTDGVNVGFNLGVGYTFDVATLKGFGIDLPAGMSETLESLRIEPFTRLNVLYTEISGFRQKGGDRSLDLSIGTQKTTSTTLSFGFNGEHPVSTKLGVLVPFFRVAYVHEFNDENDDINARIAAIPGSNFKLKANGTDKNYANIGLGVSASLGHGFSEFIDYNVIAGNSGATIHQLTAGMRLQY